MQQLVMHLPTSSHELWARALATELLLGSSAADWAAARAAELHGSGDEVGARELRGVQTRLEQLAGLR